MTMQNAANDQPGAFLKEMTKMSAKYWVSGRIVRAVVELEQRSTGKSLIKPVYSLLHPDFDTRKQEVWQSDLYATRRAALNAITNSWRHL